MCGWGEAFCAPGLTQTIRELASLLEGEDARQVEPLVRKLHLATAHVSSGGTVYHAISGIEAALWDLAARSLEVPLWQLFGGSFRDRVRIYADCHAGEALTSYSAIARLAAAAVDGERRRTSSTTSTRRCTGRRLRRKTSTPQTPTRRVRARWPTAASRR